MKRIKVFSIFPATVFIVLLCAVLSLFSPAWADDCTSTLSSDFKIHIPAVQFDTGLYYLDLQYAPSTDGTIWFDIVGAGVVDTLNCDNPAYLFIASETFYLYIPSMAYGADKYWMTLQYVTATAASPKEGLAVKDLNGEGVIAPPGTNRVPKSMVFASSLFFHEGGTWAYSIKMKSDISLVEDTITPLTSPGFSFKPASGFLYADGYCSFIPIPQIPELTGSCTIEGAGIGLFNIDSFSITDVNTSSPQIHMIYVLKFNPNQIVIHYHLCNGKDCQDSTEDLSDSIITKTYNNFHKSEMVGVPGTYQANDWSLLPGSGIPCNGCGWPYAKKLYPHQEWTNGSSSIEELYTEMALYE